MFRNISQFCKRDDGATAIEFAFVAVPFVILMMAIVEISLFFAASSLIEGATSSAARLIKTGQLQQMEDADPQEAFETALCDHASIFARCENLQFEVVQLDGFSDAANYQPEYDEDGNLVSNGFSTGGVNDIILVRTIYRYPLVLPFFQQVFSDGANGTRLIMSTVVFQTEPYDLQAEEEAGA